MSVQNIKSSGLVGSFEGYLSLLSVSIPSSVKLIRSNAFRGCLSLMNASIQSFLNIRKAGFNQKVKKTKI